MTKVRAPLQKLTQIPVVYSGSHQALFLVSDQGVIVVDCPPSLDINMKYAIGNVTDQPVRKVIYSHAHNDHIGSASIFASNNSNASVDYIAHSETAVLLEAVPGGDTGRPIPTETFEKNTTIHLGNQTVELAYFGPNHQPGNIFIYVPSSKILMLIDIVFPGWAPFFNLALAEFVPGYVKAHDISLQYDFEVFVGGHFNRVGNRKDVELAREYVYDLLDSCRRVLSDPSVDTIDSVRRAFELNPNNFYPAITAFNTEPAELCAQPIIEKWLGVLAGVDAVAISHAARMILGLRIEYGEFSVVPTVDIDR